MQLGDSDKLFVVHTVAGIATRSGGPSRSVTALADNLANGVGVQVSLVTQQLNRQELVSLPPDSKVDLRIGSSNSRVALKMGLPFWRSLDEVVREKKPDLIHDHGVWHPTNHRAARVARRLSVPLIVHPRGMLEPWALTYRGWKKRMAMWAFQRRDLDSAALLVATAEQETESIRRLGFRQPVALVPNGVVIPALDAAENRNAGDSGSTLRSLVFVGRIHPKKGLLNLIDALHSDRMSTWKVTIAGPDEAGHLKELVERVRFYRLEGSIEFIGEIDNEKKAALLRSADVFILPSFSENFGIVVAEALSYGVPVIATKGTPWQGLVERQCGWWVEPTVDGISSALVEATALTPERLKEMGQNARKYASDFEWTNASGLMADCYRWLLGVGPRPSCVEAG